jgi:hypothetical protein
MGQQRRRIGGRLLMAASIVAATLSTTSAAAQDAQAYVSGSFGRHATKGLAAGADAFVTPRVAIGGEAGVTGGESAGFVHFDAHARYHFTKSNAPQTVVPFVSGGYSLIHYFYGMTHAPHFGAGVDLAVGSGRSMRVEVRDMFRPGGWEPHFWTLRIALVSRVARVRR